MGDVIVTPQDREAAMRCGDEAFRNVSVEECGNIDWHAIFLAFARHRVSGYEACREDAARAVEAMPIQIYRDEGIGPAGRSCKPATFADAAATIRNMEARNG